MNSELNKKWVGHLAVLTVYIIFGINPNCSKAVVPEYITPEAYTALRLLVGAAGFWLISLFMPSEKVERGDFWKIAAASSIGLFLTQISFLIAITMATSIDTAIMGTLGPIFTMFFAFLFLGEPITGKKAGGVALSFAGVLYLIYNSVHSGGADHSTPLGIVLLLVNSLSFSLYLGLFRPLISKYNVVTFMKWMFLFSLLLSLPLSFRGFLETDFAAVPTRVGWEVGYLVFFATFVAYFLIPFGQKRLRPTLVSMYSYLQPILATAVSIWIGLDTLTWQKLLATILIVGGVILVSRSRARS